ncbi:hypothetical protein ORI20_27950 [Mycobacterium sp. CVI_P3]|uniref:Secreted protein n=1 Tax=Mycobacterium pinniadriaticum TaxID=2994102 RepID=A0ABT3SMY3_9MYCO|nr:hypothetical protein [Mycobacterium pinniadriaticum]MCX2934106.1 hypothetical protein [Mycobacterium pinniadriaticum]MCX2940528.1 hypothetical protein [Mycobacterium pinniadriaticum]
MRNRMGRLIACALMVASMPVAGISWAATSSAEDGCGVGMYFNWETNQCEYYDDVNVYINPCCYIGPAGPGPGPVGPGPVGPGPLGPGPIGPGRR